MSSTNKTTNYELSQFIETDRPAWLTDYNSDMRKIDSNLKEVSDIAGGASGSISALADRMSAAEGNITTNANDIDALEARADSLEAQAQSTAGTIANIQTEQITQNAGIEAATELGYNLARPYDSASTYAVGDYVLFQNTLYKCVTAIATGEAFDPTKWLAIKATDELNSGGYTLPIASASQLGGVKVGDGLSIDPVTGLLSASGGNLDYVNKADDDAMTIESAKWSSGTSANYQYIWRTYHKRGNLNILTFTIRITNAIHGNNLNIVINCPEVDLSTLTETNITILSRDSFYTSGANLSLENKLSFTPAQKRLSIEFIEISNIGGTTSTTYYQPTITMVW